MSFAVALCALAAASIGAIANYWVTGWMAIGGMVGVSLFYLGIGLLHLKTPYPNLKDEESMSSISQRTANSDNLYQKPVSRPHSASSEEASDLPEPQRTKGNK